MNQSQLKDHMNQLQKVKIVNVRKKPFIFNRGIIFYLFDSILKISKGTI